MHRVFDDARKRRSLKVFALVAALTLPLTACGPDLSKANYARTTVSGAPGASTDGPITDPAVDAGNLRLIEPCQFLDKASLAALGDVTDDPAPSSTQFEQCSNHVKDAGGKDLRVTVNLGTTVGSIGAKTVGLVGGLPKVEEDQNGTCVESALTTRNPDLGIQVTAEYSGGNACQAGSTVLENVVQKVHNSPQKYQAPQGTVLTTDPCTMVDQGTVDSVLPSKGVKAAAQSLHICTWGSASPSVTVTFLPAYPPIEGDGWQKTDIGGDVKAFKKLSATGTSDCTVEWQHRPWQGDHVEVVEVQFLDYGGKPDQEDPCGKATTAAKVVVGKLPAA